MQGSNITIWIAFAAGIYRFSLRGFAVGAGDISLMFGVSIDNLKRVQGPDARRVMLNVAQCGLSISFWRWGHAVGTAPAVLSNFWVRLVGGLSSSPLGCN